ncbi:MAG: site-specific integrase [Vannielia sp.]|uniref:site-specific integrase n=1 Tax=Vannielia sp. TaxID=2813045 RepID=UPI003B8DFF8E
MKQYAATDIAKAFIMAGGAVAQEELEGRELPPLERKHVRAAIEGTLAEIDSLAATEAKALRALGQDVQTVFGLRELLSVYVDAKGTGGQTADAMGSIVGRFIELHGDVVLEELTIAHLREYVDAIKHLPAVTSSKKLRGQKLPDLVRIGKANALAAVSDKTRARHVAMLKALTAFAPGQGYLPSDPWAAFKFTTPKSKYSAQKPRAPFSGAQVVQVLAQASTANLATIDQWAPLLAAYQGARREEIGQLVGSDVFELDGVWVMRITDEGEGQKVKNAASFRTIPLHAALIDAGFHTFAAGRPAGEFLFQEAQRWGNKLQPMRADARGRLTEAYGKRFSRLLRETLKINDKRVTFHSFRHSWEDAAEEVDMPQTHRRELAGRSKAGDSQAGYGNGPRIVALKESLDRVDPTAQ